MPTFIRILTAITILILAAPGYAGQSMDGMGMGMDDGMSGEPEFTPKQIEFFESKIRPILIANCSGCHSEAGGRLRGGLSLDSRELILKGGRSGAALIPGDPDASMLITAVRYEDPDWEMPPRGPLSRDQITALEQWVQMGAPFPGSGRSAAAADVAPGTEHRWNASDIEQGRKHWSYAKLDPEAPPVFANDEWAWNDIDRFVLAGMEERGTHPVADADKQAWLRRVTFDLTGLPPTSTEIEQFTRDGSDQAHERVVDRLLASDAYGERWGRHWLDVARYAESSGKENNILYPHAWRYRDYVIDAFNQDKPFDTFIREQIAGDLLPARDDRQEAEQLVATGFLALGVKGHNTRNRAQFVADLVDEQINTVTQGFMATTVACARCHDHKFDPIPQRDYYAMAGIFLSTETNYGTFRAQGNNHESPVISLPTTSNLPTGPNLPTQARSFISRAYETANEQAAQYEELQKKSRDARRNGATFTDADRRAFQRSRNAQGTARNAQAVLDRFDEDGKPTQANMVCVGVQENDPQNAPMLERGEIASPGERIPRGFVQVISGDWSPRIQQGSGRMQLADWIASSQNPLTARVWANRTWLHLFGDGIVSTPDNFGISGRMPTNQPLLDHVARRFIDLDYSPKNLIREIVLSHTYRLSSDYDKSNAAVDPENISIWRMPKRRLEAEAIRDAMLAAAGVLERDRPSGSAASFLEGQLRARTGSRGSRLDAAAEMINRNFALTRSVYLPIIRDRIPESLSVFDFPDTTFVSGDRDTTNVATQALFLMNSEEVIQTADAFARRLIKEERESSDRINMAFIHAFGRKPSTNEHIACRDFLREFPRSLAQDRRAREATENRTNERRRNRGRNRNRGQTSSTPDQIAIELAAWSGLCQTLFQSAEFRNLD